MFSLNDDILRLKNEIEEQLLEYFYYDTEETIMQSMKYSIEAGGKRLRPLLMLLTYNALTNSENYKNIYPYATALEYIHTYSLIHDDLPCMDNDDLRRGKPTNHKVFGEAIATLTGDALLNLAFEIMSEDILKEYNSKKVKCMQYISRASGASGMIAGQSKDILLENKPIDYTMLKYIHNNKTGKLIEASIVSGAVFADATQYKLEKMESLASLLGLAFQIKDDILDVESSTEVLGKNINSDEKNNKATYVTMFGIDEAKRKYEETVKQLNERVKELSLEDTLLNTLICEIVDRDF